MESYSVEAVLTATDRGFSSAFQKASSSVDSLMKKTADTMSSVGKKMTIGVTVPLALMTKQAVKTGTEFQSQMNRVGAIAGATGKDFDALKQQALDLGAQTVFSATEAAEGMEALASAGFNTTEIMSAMPGVLDLAAVSGNDIALAAEAAGTAVNQFGLSMSDTGHVADVFAQAAADTNAEVVDMTEALKYVGPVAGSMGISLEETAAAIGVLADAGLKGSQAGTTLRGALTRLSNPTAQAKQVMDELGLSFFDSEGKMKSLSDITGQLQNAFAGLTDEQKQQAITALFGQQAMSGMLALVNSAPGTLDSMTNSLKNSDGAAKDMADTINGGLPGAIENMKGAFETAQITVTGLLEPALVSGANKVTELLNAFNSADAGTQKFIGGMIGVAGAIGPALQSTAAYINTLVTLKNNIDNIVSNNSLVQHFKQAANSARSAIPSFQEMATGLSGIGTKAREMGETGYLAFQYFREGGISALQGLTPEIDGFLAHAQNAFSQFSSTGNVLNSFLSETRIRFSDLKGSAMELGNVGMQSFTMTSSAILKVASAGLQAVAPVAMLGAGLAAAGVAGTMFGDQLSQAFMQIATKGPEMMSSLIQGIVSRIPELINQGTQIVVQFLQAITANLPTIIQGGVQIIQSLVQGVGSNISALLGAAVQAVGQFITGIAQALPQLVVSGMQFLVQLTQGIIQNIPLIVAQARNVIMSFIQSLVANMPQIIQNGIQVIVNLIDGITTALPQIIAIAAQAIVQFIMGLSQNLPAILEGGIQIIQHLINGIVEGLPQIIESAVQIIAALISGLLKNIPKIITAGVELMFNLGVGLLKGIAKIPAMIGGALKGLWSGIKGIFKRGSDESAQATEQGMQKAEQSVTTHTQNAANTANQNTQQLKNDVTANTSQTADQASSDMQRYDQNVSSSMSSATNTVSSEANAQAAAVDSATSSASQSGIGNYGMLNAGSVEEVQSMSSQIQSIMQSMQSNVSNMMTSMGQTISTSLSNIGNSFHESFANVNLSVTQALQSMRENITSAFTSMGSAIQGSMTGIKSTIDTQLNGIKTAFATSFTGLQSTITTAFSGIVTTASTSMQTLQAAVTTGVTAVVTAFRVGMQRLPMTIASIFPQMVSAIAQGIVGMVTVSTAGLAQLRNAFTTSLAGIAGVVSTQMATIRAAVGTGVSGMVSQATAGLSSIRSAYTSAFSSIASTVSSQMSAVRSAVSSATSAIVSTVNSSTNQMKSTVQSGMNQIRSTVQSGLNQIKSNVQTTLNQIKSTVQTSMNQIKSVTQSGFNAVRSVIQSTMNASLNTVRSTMNSAVAAMRSAAGQARAAGQQMGAGFNSGLASMRGSIMSTAQSIANAAASAMRSALKIHSPSRVTRDIGGYTGEGLVIGLDGQMRNVARASQNMAQTITDSIQPKGTVDFDIGGTVQRANARVNDTISHQFNGLSLASQPAEINLSMGGNNYRAFVDDISRQQGHSAELSRDY